VLGLSTGAAGVSHLLYSIGRTAAPTSDLFRPTASLLPVGGAGVDQLEHVSWEEWFESSTASTQRRPQASRPEGPGRLAFAYQDKKANGEDSTFFKLVRR
jgi:hypothetical protein